jgi:hypothetical protein
MLLLCVVRSVRTCGTHLGDTNDVASIAFSPVSESMLMSFTLSSVGITIFSFCASAPT